MKIYIHARKKQKLVLRERKIIEKYLQRIGVELELSYGVSIAYLIHHLFSILIHHTPHHIKSHKVNPRTQPFNLKHHHIQPNKKKKGTKKERKDTLIFPTQIKEIKFNTKTLKQLHKSYNKRL